MNGYLKDFSQYLALSRQPVGKAALWRAGDVEAALKSQGLHAERLTRSLALTRTDASDAFGLNADVSLMVQALGPLEKGRSHAHSFWHLYFVLKGSGACIIEGERMTWATGDVFFVPPWAEHELENASAQEEAIVYSLQNLPQQAHGGTLMRNDPVTGRPVHIRSDAPDHSGAAPAGGPPGSPG